LGFPLFRGVQLGHFCLKVCNDAECAYIFDGSMRELLTNSL
jgi:hypothetical protein